MINYLNYNFLSKLNIYGNALARYTIPYYALSRGLKVTFLNISTDKKLEKYFKVEGNGGFYRISDERGTTHTFNYSKLLQQNQDKSIKKYSKDNLNNFLDKLGINHPHSIKFKPNTPLNIIQELLPPFPLVVKPINGSMGKGVHANLNTIEELQGAIISQKTDFLVENYITGDEFRIYTVGGIARAACKREFPHVIGNGKDKIEKLIENKNTVKQKMRIQTIRINDDLINQLNNQNLTLDYIPSEKEKIILSFKRGRSSGGDIEQNLSLLKPETIEKLEKFAKSIPEFYVLGIDCIINQDDVFILEVNFRPQITSALMPDTGNSIDLPKIIIDNIFKFDKEKQISPINFKKVLKYVENTTLPWEEITIKNEDIQIKLKSDEYWF
ncbi:ATP-grasp domain-containing protein [Acinetobacter thermotolerans]|uniref:ATP-grasp domain-containing protein n=1 Tax=Acinetobacter thermotolerans TaxID=3151487 RepID=UPI00325BF8DF